MIPTLPFQPKRVALKNGVEVTLASLDATRAAKLNTLDRRLHDSDVGLIRNPDEFRETPQETVERFEKWLAQKSGLWIIALLDGEIVGEAMLKTHPFRRLAHMAEFSIGVHPDFQGLGMGRALTAACLEWAQSAGLTRVELGVFASNVRAQQLYASLGFEREGIRKNYVRHDDGRYEDDIAMAKIWD
jgi:RimJ/RimL family protein N-acetyltransferase